MPTVICEPQPMVYQYFLLLLVLFQPRSLFFFQQVSDGASLAINPKINLILIAAMVCKKLSKAVENCLKTKNCIEVIQIFL